MPAVLPLRAFQILAVAVFRFFLQIQTVPLGDLKQHLPTGGIEGDLAVVAAAEGLVRVGQVKAQCFHIREGRRQIIRVGWSESRTEAVEAVPVDIALGSFWVDVLTVGKVETAVIVLGVVSAVCAGSSIVSC